MYHKVGLTVGAGSVAALPYTGVNIVYALLAGFALIACGMAIRRVLPRVRRR